MPDGGFPFIEGAATEFAIVAEEPLLRGSEVHFLSVELLLHINEFSIGEEVTDPAEEREGVLINKGMSPGLDQSQLSQCLLGKQFLVAEAHESIADLIGSEPEVPGVEFLVEAGIADARIHEYAFAGEDIEDVGSG